jgi:hypothetical protein
MTRPTYRKTADVLRRTLEQLEADPTVDTQTPAFIDLKCTLLSRILELETGKALSESVIHLVDSPERNVAEGESQEEHDEDSATA